MERIHIIGIGGAGTSALALLLAARGARVCGTDVGDGFYTRALTDAGMTVFSAYDAAHITPDITRVIYSTAITSDNVELRAARAARLPTQTYPEALGELTRQIRTIAVCGTHGKTTVTGLTACALVGGGADPSAIVGAPVAGWRGGARVGRGDLMVIEADEYQNKLARYEPFGVIVTSVEYDHPDFFPTPDAYVAAFADFVARAPREGFVVACGDAAAVRDVAGSARCRTVFYGTRADNDCVITSRAAQPRGGQNITVAYDGAHTTLSITLDGAHNAYNAAAAWLAASIVTDDARGSAAGLKDFGGARRRCEARGTLSGAVLLDDYAHHPTEIAATLAAVRERYPAKNVVVAFHPHTFTRTQALLADFAATLATADKVAVLDIYGSAREAAGTITAATLVDAINTIAPTTAVHVPTIPELAAWMRQTLGAADVCVTMGAGDIWKVYDHIFPVPATATM